jgi:hypothetical protein
MLEVVALGNVVAFGIGWALNVVDSACGIVRCAAAFMPVEVRLPTIPGVLNVVGACPTIWEPRSGLLADGPLRHPDNKEPTTTKPAKAKTGFVPIGIPSPAYPSFTPHGNPRRSCPRLADFTCVFVGQAA